MANDTNMPLQDVTYQYWFNGPDGVSAFATSSPMDLFELQCSDATTGKQCTDLYTAQVHCKEPFCGRIGF